MKRSSLLAALFLVFASSSALACGGPDKARQLADRLDLDDAQAEQVMTILKEQRMKMHETFQALREQGVERGSDEARAQHETLRAETHERLGAVLSAEQLARFEQMHEEKRQRMRERHRRHMERDAAAI